MRVNDSIVKTWIITKKQSLQCSILLRYHEHQTFENRYQFKRPQKLNCLHKRNIMHKVQDNPWIAALQVITDLMVDYNIKVTPQIVKKAIKKIIMGMLPVRNLL